MLILSFKQTKLTVVLANTYTCLDINLVRLDSAICAYWVTNVILVSAAKAMNRLGAFLKALVHLLKRVIIPFFA